MLAGAHISQGLAHRAKGYVVHWSIVVSRVVRRSSSMQEKGKRAARDFFLFVPFALSEQVPYFFSNLCMGAWPCLSASP